MKPTYCFTFSPALFQTRSQELTVEPDALQCHEGMAVWKQLTNQGGSHSPLKITAGCFAMSLKRLLGGGWVNRADPLRCSGSARVTADLCCNASLSHLFPSSH